MGLDDILHDSNAITVRDFYMQPKTLKAIRVLHLYSGVFLAPAILFFAFTGFLQTFSFHEVSHAPGYVPPAIFVRLSRLQVRDAPAARAETVGHSRLERASPDEAVFRGGRIRSDDFDADRPRDVVEVFTQEADSVRGVRRGNRCADAAPADVAAAIR
jgi:hypothetical protein